jgi:nicotinate-nucleotide adenylyltransferase
LGVSKAPEAARHIGVFGGSFDPPHLSHAEIAREAVAQLGLSQLLVIPSGHPPHRAGAFASAEHRLAMLRLAMSTVPNAVVDDRELTASALSYTVNTLERLQAERPTAKLFLIIGQDQWHKFDTWYRWQDIPHIAIICVATRADNTMGDAEIGVKIRPEQASEHAKALSSPMAELRPLWLVHQATNHSATAVRAALAANALAGLNTMLDPAVLRYIASHGLYGLSATT